jgi:hypothetical protein
MQLHRTRDGEFLERSISLPLEIKALFVGDAWISLSRSELREGISPRGNKDPLGRCYRSSSGRVNGFDRTNYLLKEEYDVCLP